MRKTQNIRNNKIIFISLIIVIAIVLLYMSPVYQVADSGSTPQVTYINSYDDLTAEELVFLDSILLPPFDQDDIDYFTPDVIADSFINCRTPNTNYGSSQTLEIDGDDAYHHDYPATCSIDNQNMLIKIDATNLITLLSSSGKTYSESILSMYLYMYAGSNTNTQDWSMYKISSSWNENSVTWQNAPDPHQGLLYDDYDYNQQSNKWALFPLGSLSTAIDSGENIISIALTGAGGSTNPPTTKLSSRETSYKPYVFAVFDPNFGPWVKVGIPIEHGFSIYEGIDYGTRIKVTTAELTVTTPGIIYEHESFTVGVSTDTFTDTSVTIKLYDSTNMYYPPDISGSVPNVVIPNNPLPKGTGWIKVFADRDGVTLSKNKFVTIKGIDLVVKQPSYYMTGDPFILGVAFTDPTILRPFTVEFRDVNTDSLLAGPYSGTMPSTTITTMLTGSAKMIVTTSYNGHTYSDEIVVSFDAISLVVNAPQTCNYGVDCILGVYILGHQEVHNPVTINFFRGTSLIAGPFQGPMPSVTITKPKILDLVTMKVDTSYLGVPYTRSLDLYFYGNPIVTTVHTDSDPQYEMDTIEYSVQVKDSTGEFMTPNYLSNIVPTATLSQGTVDSISYVHKGSGVYEISAEVTGVGDFVSSLSFVFLDKAFTSNTISITIKENALSVGLKDIPGSSIRGIPFTIKITVYDPKGNLVDPDGLSAFVSYPDGETKETITINQMQHVSVGTYQFSFVPNQLETYTFDVTATKAGVTTGSSYANVAVYPEDDPDKPEDNIFNQILTLIINNIIVVVLLFVCIILLIWKFKK